MSAQNPGPHEPGPWPLRPGTNVVAVSLRADAEEFTFFGIEFKHGEPRILFVLPNGLRASQWRVLLEDPRLSCEERPVAKEDE